jgi:phosphatidylethanolamine-binding protein (PEBP) family uncharacterized protein/Spy/CpxP family protein refolding chaperone
MIRTTRDRILALLVVAGLTAAAICAVVAYCAVTSPVAVEPALAATPAPGPDPQGYTIEQAISDRAQGTTIAFDALGFLTGTLAADSFFPPGKVADFWGFQYLRDNDSSELGHSGDFLTKVSYTMYDTLDETQRAKLTELAEGQVDDIAAYGMKRFTLMAAFRRLLEGDLPTGASGLDEAAVETYSAELYKLDGAISYERAQVMGAVLAALSTAQRARLDALVGKGVGEWPDVTEPAGMSGLDRDQKVVVMTYAGDLFSWYAGSVEADVYFCPERHGTYFGSFYLKDAKAMLDPTYAIPTSVTGDMGERFVAALDATQAASINGLVDAQRSDLLGMVDVRRTIAGKLRVFQTGAQADQATVMSLMDQYGRLDGDIIYKYATAFAGVGKTLTATQKQQFAAMREEMLDGLEPAGAYLYSQAIDMPSLPDTDFLFGKGQASTTTTADIVVTPSSALRGATVTITGAGFGAKRSAGSVKFGAAKCLRIFSWSAKRIRCRVPVKAAFGAVAVTVNTAAGASLSGSFTLLQPGSSPTPSPTPSASAQPGTGTFALRSSAFTDGGTLPMMYTADGAGVSPPLAWSGVPDGTKELALTVTTQALDGEKWNWVLYGIPAATTALGESTTVGTAGLSTDGPELRYYPPASKGPGAKTYTFALYALSAAPVFTVPAAQVSGPVLKSAIAGHTLASSAVSVSYTRVESAQ